MDQTKEGRPAVNIKVPVGAMVHEGAGGRIVEVEDEAGHKTIEVWLE